MASLVREDADNVLHALGHATDVEVRVRT